MKQNNNNFKFRPTKLALAISLSVAAVTATEIVVANESNPAIQAAELTANPMAKFRSVDPQRAIKDQYIVVFKDQYVTQQTAIMSAGPVDNATLTSNRSAVVASMASEMASYHNATLKNQFHSALNGFAGTMSKQDMQELLKDSRVAYIEQDQIMQAYDTQPNATWGLDRIDQANLPLDSNYTYDVSGSGVSAYVIDTGVAVSHNDFGGRAQNGYDFVDNDSVANDCNGHGTHVAGTIGSNTWGVAKGATIVGVRVLNCQGSGSNSDVIAGVDWVRQNAVKPAVANMSLGGGSSTALDNAVNNAINSGVAFVVAAGNSNSDACVGSPNRVANALTTASSTSSDARSSFSSWGSCIDLFAPGSSITSTWHTGGSNTISGTSMAAPHVAGVAALYLQSNPNASWSAVNSAVVGNAVSGKISSPNGSPNLLLQSRFGSTPPPPPGGNELDKGVPVTNLSGAQGSEVFYTMEVPAGASDLNFDISGGTGDADMYVRFGSAPTTSTYDCRPYRNGNNENCNFANPSTGTYHVMLRGYSSYSGTQLVGDYTTGGGGGTDPISETINDISVSQGGWYYHTVDLSGGYSDLTVTINGGSGDGDLYVRQGSQPTTSSYDCRPYRNGNSETCSFNNPGADVWHIGIRGYRTSSGITLTVQANP